MIQCRLCKESKSISNFSPNQIKIKNNTCKTCVNLISKKWRNENKEKVRITSDRRNKARSYSMYGVSKDWYEKKLIEQGGRCAICGNYSSAYRRRFAIDHCHISGITRGLLCIRCNAGIGQFKDNEQNLINAIEYLKSYAKETGK